MHIRGYMGGSFEKVCSSQEMLFRTEVAALPGDDRAGYKFVLEFTSDRDSLEVWLAITTQWRTWR